MTRRLKKTKDFQISIEILNENFIRPPKDSQRNVLLNNALNELSWDLKHLNVAAKKFVVGDTQISLEDRTQKILTDEEIMEDWQIPLMQAMAESVTETKGDILEIGFGRGIASTLIQEQNVRSHTIIECNDSVIEKFCEWKSLFEERNIKIVHGLWQETIDDLGLFDGIFFHTYPLNEDEYMEYVHGEVTFAGHFFETAAKHLRVGGAFTYFSNEIDSLSRSHQRLLFEHFSSFSLKLIDLEIPENVQDTWWADTMVVVKAVK